MYNNIPMWNTEGVKYSINHPETFYIELIKYSPLCHVYNECGEYLTVFSGFSFFVRNSLSKESQIYKVLHRNRQIDSILKD